MSDCKDRAELKEGLMRVKKKSREAKGKDPRETVAGMADKLLTFTASGEATAAAAELKTFLT